MNHRLKHLPREMIHPQRRDNIRRECESFEKLFLKLKHEGFLLLFLDGASGEGL